MRPIAAILAGTLCAAAGSARADGIGGQAEVGYGNSTITTTDETGAKTKVDGESLTQRYRLSLDETLYPLVKFSGSGLLDWVAGSSRTGGIRSDFDTKTWDGNGHLTFGSPILSGGLDYDRREQTSESRTAGGPTLSAPRLVRDTYSGSLSWHPVDMPSLDLRLSRVDAYDSQHRSIDQTGDEALLTSRYDPTSTLDLRYAARYATVDNRLGGVRGSELTNSGTVTWTDRFLQDRGNAYVGYSITTRNTQTSTTGAGGNVLTQRPTTAGLSIVEGPLDTPNRVTLNPNAALVDGVTTTSAGVNLGFNASAGPLVTFRDLGAQLPNSVTRVALVYVFVDRNAAPVADQFTWSAYQSDDNITWTSVGLAGAVTFDPLLWRFEIPISSTAARYLKVVTKPLVKQLTTDPQFADIFVSELQLFDVIPASELRGRSFNLAGTLNGTSRILLLRSPSLSYDLSVVLSHTNPPFLFTYSVVNGLGLQQRLSPTVLGSARVDRSDSDSGKGHEGLNRWSGTLGFEPIPTLGATLAYTGQLAQHPTGNALSHSGTAFARAELYEGISTSVTGSASWANDETGRTTRATTGSAAASLVPNRVISITGSGSLSYSTQTGAGLPERVDRRGVVEGSVSLSPYRSVSLAGSVLRYFGNTGSSTLVNLNGAVALFPRGDLQLTYSYVEALDLGADTRSRTHGPGLRWNIRPGWYLTAAYTLQHSSAPAQTLDGQAISATLLIALR